MDNTTISNTSSYKEEQGYLTELSVSELAYQLKNTIEKTFSYVRLRGELSRVTLAASGHMYADIKDESAVINTICWRSTYPKLSIKPEEGLDVIVTGKVTTYPARSNYQLIINSMTLAGEGALLKMLEERKKKLAAEGYFSLEKKKKLPYLPNIIGVITSPSGAVIKDIMHRLDDRFPRHVLLWPVTVQGEQASTQIIGAIKGFETIDQNSEIKKPDLIIIARGGGSLEDLMPFNDELLVKTAAQCTIPIISAIGHETDTTLLDLVADKRAPTPTGAAEMAVPVRQEVFVKIQDYERKISNYVRLKLTNYSNVLDKLHSKLGDPQSLIGIKFQHLDHITLKLKSCYDRFLFLKADRLKTLSLKLQDPKRVLAEKSTQLTYNAKTLFKVGSTIIKTKKDNLMHSSRMLESLSFHRVLERGYAVVRNADSKILTSSTHLKDGQKIVLEFKDNDNLNAIVDKKT